jgi:hypothetical protein
LHNNARFHAACATHKTIQKLNRNFLVTHTTTHTSPRKCFSGDAEVGHVTMTAVDPGLHSRFSEAGEVMDKCINAMEDYVGKFLVSHFNYCLL